MQLIPQPALTRRRRSWLTLVVMFAVYSCSQLASAQSLQLSTETPKAGESIRVTGLELTPGAQVTARLTAPGGRVSRQSAQVGDGGRFRLELTLPTGGRYQLTVRGSDVERTWQLTVPKPQPDPPAKPQPKNKTGGPAQPEGQPAGQNAGQSLTPSSTSAEGALQVTRSANGVSATQGGEPLWSLTFPAGSGPTTQPLLIPGASGSVQKLYLGHGNSVLRLKAQTGSVSTRLLVSGPVTRLEKVDDETVRITVRHAQGLLERFTLKNDVLQEPVRFGTDPAIFSYLRAEANIPEANVATLSARLRRDPTNPWLYLRLGLEQRNPEARRTFQSALNEATTFYDLAGLATVLERRGERKLAAAAFDQAMKDFAARGYDPRLLTDETLAAAYNFPLGPLERALNAGDDLSAEFWAERSWLAAPNVPGAAGAFGEYAALLRQLGTPAPAALWEGRAASKTVATGGALGGRLEHLGSALAQNGWKLVPALLTAFVALHLTLLAKYAHARRSDRVGGRMPWLFALRYDTLSEKLVLLALLALTLVCAALGSWAAQRGPSAQIIGSGTLANRAAQAYLSEADLRGPRAAFIRGTAAQILGDTQAAQLLRRAGNYAPALNNLGVLTGDKTLYRRVLGLEPALPAARYNVGDKSLLPFQASYDTRPALALPTSADFSAAAGSWQAALTGAFTNPQLVFSTPPYGFSLGLWRTLQLLFLLVALVHVGFLVVPRPRSAYSAPRGRAYLPFAFLFPGTALADELWGIFLLVPWAVLGAAALSLFGFKASSATLTYLVLAGIYGINTVAVIVEGWSHRLERRTLELRRSRP